MGTHYAGTEVEKRALDAFIKLIRAAESVGLRLSRNLMGSGLTGSQFGVLEALYHLGPLPISEIAKKHLKSPNNLTTVVDNLEKSGLVRRERIAEDRRVVMVHLTPAGREALLKVLPGQVEAIVEEMSVLTPEELEQFGALCRRLGKHETCSQK